MKNKYVSKGKKIKRSTGDLIFDTFNVILMLLLIVIVIVPIIHVVSVSLSASRESMLGGFYFWPKGEINLKGYMTVIRDKYFFTSYWNTILYSVCWAFFTLFFTSLTAYPLATSGFCLKKPITVFLTIPMFIGGGMIPTYLLMIKLNLIDTFWVMVIPGCVGSYNVILFRTFFQGIPSALRDAARIDGANEFTIFTRVYFPLSKAIYSTIGLFAFVAKWNDWYSALIYLNDEKKHPVQMILRKILYNTDAIAKMDEAARAMIQQAEVTTQNIRMASIILTILPVVCIYPFIQKYFVKGMFVGTIKG